MLKATAALFFFCVRMLALNFLSCCHWCFSNLFEYTLPPPPPPPPPHTPHTHTHTHPHTHTHTTTHINIVIKNQSFLAPLKTSGGLFHVSLMCLSLFKRILHIWSMGLCL